MTSITLGEDDYRVQFTHQSKLTKRQTLFRGPLKVLSTCVVIKQSPIRGSEGHVLGKRIAAVAVGHAMCLPEDNFSRRRACASSFRRAVAGCPAFRDVGEALIAAFEKLYRVPAEPPKYSGRDRRVIGRLLKKMAGDLGPAEGAVLQAAEALISPSREKQSLSEAQIREKIEAGARVREMRQTPEGRAAASSKKRKGEAGGMAAS